MKRSIDYCCTLILVITSLDLYSQYGSASGSQEGKLQQDKMSLQFRNVGPSRGGRVTAVCGVVKEPGTFYMGAAGGGLWKSTDYGIHWSNISDGHFDTPSIGAIAVYQEDPDILYVGTGSDAIRSNVIVGKGMYRSEDAGMTWSFAGLKEAGQIGAVLIHPDDPKKVYVAAMGQPFRKSAERGVYRTLTGGASWEKILYLNDSVGAVDLEFAPDNPEILYATLWRAERKPWTIISGGAQDGIYRSEDGGDHWQKLTNGLPTGLTGKIDLAVSQAKPDRVWAQIQASGDQEGIYRSDDHGESWEKVPLPEKVHRSVMYRPFYFTNIDVNPGNADHIWVGTKIFWTSCNGGKTWREIPASHADHHDLWIHPEDTLLMIAGNDGGASVSRDGGRNWTHQFNQPTAELYSCYVDDQYPWYLYSGQQDNSTIRVPSSRPGQDVLNSNDHHNMTEMTNWERVGGCETGPVIPKPGDPNIVYANCKGQFSVYNTLTGIEQNYYVGGESLYGNHPDDITYRFQRVTPMEVSPHDPDRVYYGSQYLHQTTDGGVTWKIISPDLTANEPQYRMRSGGPIDEDISGEEYYAVLYAIEESSIAPGVIWTGSNDGRVHVTRDGGRNWNDITPNMLPGGRVSKIEASPHNAAKAYVAVYRDYLGDNGPYIFKTENYGLTWQRLTDGKNGIPNDHPTRVVREDPDREGLLYTGTEFGFFISFDDGKRWKTFQQNLPVTPVTDIQVFRKSLALSTLGRSFWVMDDISPLHRYEPDKTPGFQVFRPKDVMGGIQHIHFTLPDTPADSTISFEFKKNGHVVHYKEENLKRLPGNSLGIRKTEWDLRHYLKSSEKKDFRGPLVAPGEVTVTVKYGEQALSQKFMIRIPPDLEKAGTTRSDLIEQEEAGLKIARLLVEIREKISEFEALIKQADSEKEKQRLQLQLSYLKKGPKRYDQPKLQEHTEYLFDIIAENYQKPGKDVHTRYEQLKNTFQQLKENHK